MNLKMFRNLAIAIATMLFSSLLYAEAVWIDVRSAIEHKIDNIEGDARITHSEIVEEVNTLYPDKNTEIHLYCRSGGRAGRAMLALQAQGYTNVANAGGINSAREQRGLSD
mgnify:CR=1 FL=1